MTSRRQVPTFDWSGWIAAGRALRPIPADPKPAPPQKSHMNWLTPTTYRDRFADAVERLCGRRAPDDMVDAWLTPGCDDTRLQEFAIEHGPAWAQGIVLLDAADLLAENPAEGADHAPRT